SFSVFFFFQAEDGIRDATVTGVQTCALPICVRLQTRDGRTFAARMVVAADGVHGVVAKRLGLLNGWRRDALAVDLMEETPNAMRSEERRVGKECRYGWGEDDEKNKEERKRRQ